MSGDSTRDPMLGYRTWLDAAKPSATLGGNGKIPVATGRKVTYEDNSTFVGELVQGNRHGRGVYTLPSGSCYRGEFYDDQMHGYAQFTMAPQEEGDESEVYEGEFRDGAFHGAGQYIYADGGVYLGEWDDGMMHGVGRYFEETPPGPNMEASSCSEASASVRLAQSQFFLPPKEELDMASYSGAYYEGGYFEDEKHGHGLYISGEDDGAQYEGEWFQGKMHGTGVHHDSKGNRYEGEFQDNLMHGVGVMSLVGQDAEGNILESNKRGRAGHHSGGDVEDNNDGAAAVIFDHIVSGTWVQGNRVDEATGKILHRGTDPSSIKEKSAARAAVYAEEEEKKQAEWDATKRRQKEEEAEKAQAAISSATGGGGSVPPSMAFRHTDSRVVELPDDFE